MHVAYTYEHTSKHVLRERERVEREREREERGGQRERVRDAHVHIYMGTAVMARIG